MFIAPEDLAPFVDIELTKAMAMIDDAEAMATLAAPCITDAEFRTNPAKAGALKAILRGAILRWHEAGTGAVVQQTAGPFAQTTDTSKARRGMFWPSEIEQIRGLCNESPGQKAYTVDTAGPATVHLPWCSLHFGATYCSCGVDIAGYPIFEAP